MIYDIYQFSLYWISLTCFTNKYLKSRPRQLLTSDESACWDCCWKLYTMTMLSGIFSFCLILSLYLRGYSLNWGETCTQCCCPAYVLSRVSIKRVLEAVWVESGRKTSIILCFIFASFDKRESSIIFKVLRFWSYTLRPFVLDSTVSVRVQCMTIWHALVGQLRNRKNCHSHVNTSRQLKEEIGIHCLGWRKQ